MEHIRLQTGLKIVGFNHSKIKSLISTGNIFSLNINTVKNRDALDITVKVNKDILDVNIICDGYDSDDEDYSSNYEVDRSSKDLEEFLYDMLDNYYD